MKGKLLLGLLLVPLFACANPAPMCKALAETGKAEVQKFLESRLGDDEVASARRAEALSNIAQQAVDLGCNEAVEAICNAVKEGDIKLPGAKCDK